MDTYQALMTRRSVRQFTPQPVHEEQAIAMIRAAMQAPSAHNERPWHFVLIDDRSILNEYAKYHSSGTMLPETSIAILVCTDLRLEQTPNTWQVSCANAAFTILLAAHAAGLGAVWLGIAHDPQRSKAISCILELPDHVKPFAMVALGYPAEPLPVVDRFDTARVHYNCWE